MCVYMYVCVCVRSINMCLLIVHLALAALNIHASYASGATGRRVGATFDLMRSSGKWQGAKRHLS